MDDMAHTINELDKAIEGLKGCIEKNLVELSQQKCTISKQEKRIKELESQLKKDNLQTCPHCNGSGIKSGHGNIPCLKCYGSGEIKPKEPPIGTGHKQ